MIVVTVCFASNAYGQTRSGSFYGQGNSKQGRMSDGTKYSRYNNTTKQDNIRGLNNQYSNGVRRQTSGNHIYDSGKYNRMGITRPYGGGTRTYYGNGQVDTQRGNQLKQERYAPQFPLYRPYGK